MPQAHTFLSERLIFASNQPCSLFLSIQGPMPLSYLSDSPSFLESFEILLLDIPVALGQINT